MTEQPVYSNEGGSVYLHPDMHPDMHPEQQALFIGEGGSLYMHPDMLPGSQQFGYPGQGPFTPYTPAGTPAMASDGAAPQMQIYAPQAFQQYPGQVPLYVPQGMTAGGAAFSGQIGELGAAGPGNGGIVYSVEGDLRQQHAGGELSQAPAAGGHQQGHMGGHRQQHFRHYSSGPPHGGVSRGRGRDHSYQQRGGGGGGRGWQAGGGRSRGGRGYASGGGGGGAGGYGGGYYQNQRNGIYNGHGGGAYNSHSSISHNGYDDVSHEQNRGPRTMRGRSQRSSAAAADAPDDAGVAEGATGGRAGAGAGAGAADVAAEGYNAVDFRTKYRAAKFFVIKSYSEDDVHKSIKYNVWASTPGGNKKLQQAYEEAARIAAGGGAGGGAGGDEGGRREGEEEEEKSEVKGSSGAGGAASDGGAVGSGQDAGEGAEEEKSVAESAPGRMAMANGTAKKAEGELVQEEQQKVAENAGEEGRAEGEEKEVEGEEEGVGKQAAVREQQEQQEGVEGELRGAGEGAEQTLEGREEEEEEEGGEVGEGCPVFLLFSVNASGQFCGVAQMMGPVDFSKSCEYWQQDKWNGQFPVKWHLVKDVPNGQFRHIILANNENKPVTNSRDTQEVSVAQGQEVLTIFKNYDARTSILDDFTFYDNRQKTMLERRSKQQQQQRHRSDSRQKQAPDGLAQQMGGLHLKSQGGGEEHTVNGVSGPATSAPGADHPPGDQRLTGGVLADEQFPPLALQQGSQKGGARGRGEAERKPGAGKVSVLKNGKTGGKGAEVTEAQDVDVAPEGGPTVGANEEASKK
eukprot:jgi/Mesen1/10495/ME000083S09994